MKKITKKTANSKKGKGGGAKTTVKKSSAKKAATTKPVSNEKIGVFGGAFNPVHTGHLNAALTVKLALNLKKVLLVPSNEAPNRQVLGPAPEERLEMVRLSIKAYEPELEASDIEIKRGGISYTFETLKELGKTFKAENIYFILGADNFRDLPNWRNFEELIALSNFVVTTRPGATMSFDEGSIPPALGPFIQKRDKKVLSLNSGKTIRFVELEDIDTSSTDLRKRIRMGYDVKKFIPPAVLEYISDKSFYKRTSPLVKNYRDFALFCAQRILDKKGLALKAYDMTGMNTYVDYSLICSATSTKHAASVAEGVIQAAKEEYGLNPISIEGIREGLWVLIDFGAVVVHVFDDVVRGQYNIEGLWRRSPEVEIPGQPLKQPVAIAPRRDRPDRRPTER